MNGPRNTIDILYQLQDTGSSCNQHTIIVTQLHSVVLLCRVEYLFNMEQFVNPNVSPPTVTTSMLVVRSDKETNCVPINNILK